MADKKSGFWLKSKFKEASNRCTMIFLCIKWRVVSSASLISSTKEMNPITRKSVSNLVIQPSLRVVGQKATEWKAFEKPENKKQMHGSKAWEDGVYRRALKVTAAPKARKFSSNRNTLKYIQKE